MNRARTLLCAILEVGISKFYHATSVDNALEILRTDRLVSVRPNISFTRSPSYWYDIGNNPVRLVFDAERLRERIKLHPYAHAGKSPGRHYEFETQTPTVIRDQRLVPYTIDSVSRYLLGIEIVRERVSPEYIRELADRAGRDVPLHFVSLAELGRSRSWRDVPGPPAHHLVKQSLGSYKFQSGLGTEPWRQRYREREGRE